jgi:hypothetical protein
MTAFRSDFAKEGESLSISRSLISQAVSILSPTVVYFRIPVYLEPSTSSLEE